MHVIDANFSLYSTYTMSLKCAACKCVLDETFLCMPTFIHCRQDVWMLKLTELDQLQLSFVKLSFAFAGVNSL